NNLYCMLKTKIWISSGLFSNYEKSDVFFVENLAWQHKISAFAPCFPRLYAPKRHPLEHNEPPVALQRINPCCATNRPTTSDGTSFEKHDLNQFYKSLCINDLRNRPFQCFFDVSEESVSKTVGKVLNKNSPNVKYRISLQRFLFERHIPIRNEISSRDCPIKERA
ncbi:MAG: hypothetical protein MR681_02550, partial [Prevotella sp.]|nr:hypothetical protein [Prevotella sp.]